MSAAWWSLWRDDRYPLLAAVTDRWALTPDDELSRLAKCLNAYYHHTRLVRLTWWKAMLEKPAQTAERRGTSRLTVTLCRMRGHAPRIFYNPGGMEPDDRCSRCLEEY